MFGIGILKGLGVTMKHFITTYVEDFRYLYFPGSLRTEEAFARRQGPEGRGIFTVEYPEVKLQVPENFRFLPFLVTDYVVPADSLDFEREKYFEQNRCTSCGICAKVCPPQCIWIVRTNDPETGKPIPQPAEFYIDTDICMNCGYCAEFCPFDAIKMDHDFELADYSRADDRHVYDLEELLKPVSYYAAIRPTWHARQIAEEKAAEEEKKRKAAEAAAKKAAKEKAAKEKEAKEEAAGAPATSGDGAKVAQSTSEVRRKRSPEEIKAQREAMMAKKQQRQESAEKTETEVAEAVEKATAVQEDEGVKPDEVAKEGKSPKRTPEEIKAQREAMMAKRKARELQEGGGE